MAVYDSAPLLSPSQQLLQRFRRVGENGELRGEEQHAPLDEQHAENEEDVGDGEQMEELEHPTELRRVDNLLGPKRRRSNQVLRVCWRRQWDRAL